MQQDTQANTDADLARLYADLDTYLAVPQALLAGQGGTGDAARHHGLVLAANTVEDHVTLFGGERTIDCTMFTPRGHYTTSPELTRYFQAMMWLSLIDFRLLATPPCSSACGRQGSSRSRRSS